MKNEQELLSLFCNPKMEAVPHYAKPWKNDGYVIATDGYDFMCVLQDDRQIPIDGKAIDIIDYRPYVFVDWEQRRYEIAKECFAGIYNSACDDSLIQGNHKKMAKTAVYLADELIKQLKGDNK